MNDWYRYQYFPPSRPRAAKGGIRAQSQGGRFGKNWWAKRWIEVLETFQLGARLQRGRSYARRGQVLSIQIDEGIAKAEVQGSRPKPYKVSILAKRLELDQWQKLAATLSRQAIYPAKLLHGEMPAEIEDEFRKAGLSLFPERLGDLSTKCSCPDWSNPCKHIAAVYYLLGEEFDRDPFLIFKLRGMGREDFTGLLAPAAGSGSGSGSGTGAAMAVERETVVPVPPEPLPAAATSFWRAASLPDDLCGPLDAPSRQAGVIRRLGAFPFWRGQQRFLEAMDPIYAAAAERGLKAYLGEPEC